MTNQQILEHLDNIWTFGHEPTDEEREAVRAAMDIVEKQIEKKPKRIQKKYGKHTWERKEDGTIDDFAFEYNYHNGVRCEVCGETVCVHCNPDYDKLTDCEVKYWECPTCKERVPLEREYCKCGQKLNWSDNE